MLVVVPLLLLPPPLLTLLGWHCRCCMGWALRQPAQLCWRRLPQLLQALPHQLKARDRASPAPAPYGPPPPLLPPPTPPRRSPQTMMLGQEPRQTTSNVGHLNKPSIQVRGCGRNLAHNVLAQRASRLP